MTTNGNDLIYGGLTSQTIDGRGGNDTVWYNRVPGNIALDLADNGTFVYKNNGSFDTLVNIEAVATGGSQNDIIMALGSSKSVTIDLKLASLQVNGTTRKLTVTGFDNIIGSFKGDTLLGNDGNNWFNGTRGGDVLTGRGGADIFSYDSWQDSYGSNNLQRYVAGGTMDIITDFESGKDKIDLRCVSDTLGRKAVWVGDRSYLGRGIEGIGFGEVGLIGNQVVANFGNQFTNLGKPTFLQIDIYNTGSTFPSRPNVQQTDVLL